MKIRWIGAGLVVLAVASGHARAGVLQYGDRNLLGTGTYPSDPTAGAAQQGLAPGAVAVATQSFDHTYPFTPGPGEFPGTDQIYSNGGATNPHDGYSASPGTVGGPQVLTMDYHSLVPAGQKVDTLTLGIAADDFQQPPLHEPFEARINGIVNVALTNELNSLDLSGPKVQYFSVGLDPALAGASDVLTLSINRNGPAADGWAVDFTTVGVTTEPVPEPTTLWVLLAGFVGLGLHARRRGRIAA